MLVESTQESKGKTTTPTDHPDTEAGSLEIAPCDEGSEVEEYIGYEIRVIIKNIKISKQHTLEINRYPKVQFTHSS